MPIYDFSILSLALYNGEGGEILFHSSRRGELHSWAFREALIYFL